MASVLRTFARRSVVAPVRSFSTSQVARKDLIQDLYLNQLRSYKPSAKVRYENHAVPSLLPPQVLAAADAVLDRRDELTSVIVQAADAHLSSVKSYAAPAAPQAPTLPSDLTAELSKFDATEPVLSSSTSTTAATVAATEDEGVAGGAKEYLEFLEKDTPKADAHH
ncbi:hypothetical protein QFC24_003255 [Naganishia onofrii]|uniref:Uncharacterized protein n=1 Tax=Naganishia onofrii TaxID=1851511 RepID=A0ACC2XKB9_9TREE|nr:hypothetical protein QFC24_003255 [Naganishia onofrii]